ncbi:hypothetical protein CBR_g36706 [Chara braunii]|uniref:Uncharacterized protein n=1 Tax=Chara braunii TaxID=69332 RepID=A0A388LL89_CHABU|nr:hypothetical protein CBR_g36706 [Chara braunii]|eukprot:GBG83088.1 hypothetical protein CBR_g36706 [Chara braunii]
MDAIKTAWDTGRFPHFFEMVCFSDLAVLAAAWERSREEFDDELRVFCEKLELRKGEYDNECRELVGRTARVEQILLRIWEVDDSHLEGRVPTTVPADSPVSHDGHVVRCDDLAIEDEEKEEMERAIAAITATIKDSPLTANKDCTNTFERDRYTTFAPIASTCWVEHMSTTFQHTIWKMETFNHIAPISVRALQFLGNITDAQVKECRAQVLKDNPLLQGIINCGLNHISSMALDVEQAVNEVDGFLERLFAMVMELRELTTSIQSFLRKIILKKARNKMTKYREEHRHVIAEPFEHPAVKSELRFLTSRFLICPTDKAPNTPAFVCKNFVRKLAIQRLSGPEFTSIPSPLQAVIARIQGELSAFRALPATTTALPYLMTVYKAHKGTFHWITNTANTVISPAADLCACLLRFLLPLAQAFCQERSQEVEEQYGVKPNLWWAIALVGEFCANLPEKIFSVFTADIMRCFEMIPTDCSEDSLPAAVSFYVQCAMRVQRERSFSHAIKVIIGADDRLRPTWVDVGQAEGMDSMIFSEQDICWLTEWCIGNNILRMEDHVWRQTRGIPMGLACSPIWCDIYFFKHEYHAMMRLIDTGNAHLVPCFANTVRYIDNLSSINNTIIRDFMRSRQGRENDDPCWIYPDEFIKIEENTEVVVDGWGCKANFLGMTISITSPITGSYTTSRHDKRLGLGFVPCRFMRYRSNRSAKQSLQIITAQVALIMLLCSEPKDAAEEINKVVTIMRGNGFAIKVCWRVVKKTLRNAHRYQPGRVSVRAVREALLDLYGVTDSWTHCAHVP